MLRRRGLLLLGTALLLALPEFAGADKNPDKKDKPGDDDKLVRLGELVGTLTHVEGAQKYLTLKYTQQVVVPDPQAALQGSVDLVRRQYEILRDPNPLSRRQQLMQLAAEQQRNQLSAFQVRQVSVDLELHAA